MESPDIRLLYHRGTALTKSREKMEQLWNDLRIINCQSLEQQINIPKFGIQMTQSRQTHLVKGPPKSTIYVSNSCSSSPLVMHYLVEPLAVYLGFPDLKEKIRSILDTDERDMDELLTRIFGLPELPMAFFGSRPTPLENPLLQNSSSPADDILQPTPLLRLDDVPNRSWSPTPAYTQPSGSNTELLSANPIVRSDSHRSREEAAAIMKSIDSISFDIWEPPKSNLQGPNEKPECLQIPINYDQSPRLNVDTDLIDKSKRHSSTPRSPAPQSSSGFPSLSSTIPSVPPTFMPERVGNEESNIKAGFAGEYFVTRYQSKLIH
jgi:hypothetical protein